MKISRKMKMAVRKLHSSDNGGVMTKIMGSHTGDHSIQLFKLNKNDKSIGSRLLNLPPKAVAHKAA